jgi:hypothetical protein
MKAPVICILSLALIGLACGKKASPMGESLSLDELNRIVATITMHQGGTLPDTNEVAQFLVRTGKTFPSPPPGRTLLLNPATRRYEYAAP